MKTKTILLISALLALAACGRTYDTRGMTIDQLEELALETYSNSDYADASRLYTELMFTYPGSANTDFYLYMLGMSEAGNRYWADAVFYFDRVQSEYPRSQWTDDCAFETAMVWWTQRKDYRKDLTPVLNCRDQLNAFFDRYSGSDLISRAHDLMSEVNDYLARRALFIGQFYTRRNKLDAALLYLREAMNDYGQPECLSEVLISMGDVYAIKGNEYTAREFYQRAMDETDLTEDELAELQLKMDEL